MRATDAEPRGTGSVSPGMQRNARLALVALLLGLGLWTVRSFLPALTWAAILAVAIWPFYDRVRSRRPADHNSIALPALFTAGVAVVFGLPFILLAVQAGREAHELLLLFQRATTSGVAVPEWVSHLPFGADQIAAWWRDNLSSPVPTAAILKRVNQGSMLALTRRFGTEIAHRTVIFFFMLMTFFFLLRDGDGLVRDLLDASYKLFGARGERIARQMVQSIHGTVDGLVLVGIGEGLLMGIAYVVAGVPHPTLLGALTAVAAMIPFAVFVVFAIAAMLLLAQGAVAAAITIAVLGTLVVLLADHLVRPALIGGATRLPFLWVLFGILGGVESWGVVGLFIGPALMAALIMLWREFLETATPAEPSAATHALGHDDFGSTRSTVVDVIDSN